MKKKSLDKYSFGRKNSEGYLDLTAFYAIVNIEGNEPIMDNEMILDLTQDEVSENVQEQTEEQTEKKKRKFNPDSARFYRLLNAIFTICSLAGFHVEGHIKLKDLKTGKIWY